MIEVRGLAGIGLAGTLLVVLGLAVAPDRRVSWKTGIIVGGVWSAGVLVFLLWQRPTLLGPPVNAPFLTTSRLLGLEATAIALGFAYLLLPARWAVVALAAPFILKTALINPICIGLPELLASPTLRDVRQMVQADPAAEWVFYDSLAGAEVLKSTGAHVIGGVRVIPDPALIRLLDPRGENASVYNRYAHLIFSPAPPGTPIAVKLSQRVFCLVRMSVPQALALFPRLKYLAAAGPSPELEAAGLPLLRRWPQDHLSVYGRGPD